MFDFPRLVTEHVNTSGLRLLSDLFEDSGDCDGAFWDSALEAFDPIIEEERETIPLSDQVIQDDMEIKVTEESPSVEHDELVGVKAGLLGQELFKTCSLIIYTYTFGSSILR